MYSLHDTRSSVANIFPFSDQPDAGGEFERENPRPALKHSHTRPDVPLLSAWKHGYEEEKDHAGSTKRVTHFGIGILRVRSSTR